MSFSHCELQIHKSVHSRSLSLQEQRFDAQFPLHWHLTNPTIASGAGSISVVVAWDLHSCCLCDIFNGFKNTMFRYCSLAPYPDLNMGSQNMLFDCSHWHLLAFCHVLASGGYLTPGTIQCSSENDDPSTRGSAVGYMDWRGSILGFHRHLRYRESSSTSALWESLLGS